MRSYRSLLLLLSVLAIVLIIAGLPSVYGQGGGGGGVVGVGPQARAPSGVGVTPDLAPHGTVTSTIGARRLP